MNEPADIIQVIRYGSIIQWPQRCQLVEELHIQRQREKGTPQTGRPDSLVGKMGWGIRDTARELGFSVGGICEELQLAAALRANSYLATIEDRSLALRVVKGFK